MNMRHLKHIWKDDCGQAWLPGIVGALVIAFLAIVVYKVLFNG